MEMVRFFAVFIPVSYTHLEFGHTAGVDYTRNAKDATAELGKEVSDAVVEYILRFIDEFVNFEFEFKK